MKYFSLTTNYPYQGDNPLRESISDSWLNKSMKIDKKKKTTTLKVATVSLLLTPQTGPPKEGLTVVQGAKLTTAHTTSHREDIIEKIEGDVMKESLPRVGNIGKLRPQSSFTAFTKVLSVHDRTWVRVTSLKSTF